MGDDGAYIADIMIKPQAPGNANSSNGVRDAAFSHFSPFVVADRQASISAASIIRTQLDYKLIMALRYVFFAF